MQSVEDRETDHGKHVWRKLRMGEGWKCVVCGGLSHDPTDDCECRKYEALTDEDRKLLPPAKPGRGEASRVGVR